MQRRAPIVITSLAGRALALLLLLACHIGLWAIVALPDTHAFERAQLVRDSLVVAQLGLLLAWAVLGPGPTWVRFLSFPMLALWPAYLVYSIGREWVALPKAAVVPVVMAGEVALEGLWLRFAAVVLAGLIACRLMRYRVCFHEPEGAPSPVQFSLRTLLITTTLVAVAIAVGPKLQLGVNEPTVPDTFAYWSLATPLALATLGTVWAVMRPGGVAGRLPFLAVWTVSLGYVPSYLTRRPDDLTPMVAWTVVACAIVAVSLLAVRSTGAVLLRCGEEQMLTSAVKPKVLPIHDNLSV